MLRAERSLILGGLLGLAALAWGLLVWQAQMPMPSTPTAGMEAPLFLAMWVTMMVAIMFPTAAPMILTFAAVQAGKRQRGDAFVPTWIFVAAYLLVWSALGTVAYLAALLAETAASDSMWLMENGGRIGGLVLVLAGLYQLSPLKITCLSKCRTPLSFIMTSWKDGTGGAFRMGLEHGLYCAGCCWLLFVILFPLGVMNVLAMVLLTALIFAEKSIPIGPRVAQGAAVALLGYGLLVILMPGLLPGMPMPEATMDTTMPNMHTGMPGM